MLRTLRDAFKIKDIRKKLIFTFLMMVVVRLGSQLPVPEHVIAQAIVNKCKAFVREIREGDSSLTSRDACKSEGSFAIMTDIAEIPSYRHAALLHLFWHA